MELVWQEIVVHLGYQAMKAMVSVWQSYPMQRWMRRRNRSHQWRSRYTCDPIPNGTHSAASSASRRTMQWAEAAHANAGPCASWTMSIVPEGTRPPAASPTASTSFFDELGQMLSPLGRVRRSHLFEQGSLDCFQLLHTRFGVDLPSQNL